MLDSNLYNTIWVNPKGVAFKVELCYEIADQIVYEFTMLGREEPSFLTEKFIRDNFTQVL